MPSKHGTSLISCMSYQRAMTARTSAEEALPMVSCHACHFDSSASTPHRKQQHAAMHAAILVSCVSLSTMSGFLAP